MILLAVDFEEQSECWGVTGCWGRCPAPRPALLPPGHHVPRLQTRLHVFSTRYNPIKQYEAFITQLNYDVNLQRIQLKSRDKLSRPCLLSGLVSASPCRSSTRRLTLSSLPQAPRCPAVPPHRAVSVAMPSSQQDQTAGHNLGWSPVFGGNGMENDEKAVQS